MSERLSTDALAALMAAGAVSPAEQLRQTAFRVALVDAWEIPAGARVLEIGCGQGDTTAVLADAVGKRGRVIAVDAAEPTYGAPITIGDSARHLSDGPLGSLIKFRYGFDVLDPENAFPDDAFDAIVLAHCTWYFDSLDQLRQTLRQIRPWAPRLYLSEWDLEPRALDQTAHLLAVLIQGQIEAYRSQSTANVRTPYSREALRGMLAGTGWAIDSETLVDASALDDAAWEIDACLGDSLPEADRLDPPARARAAREPGRRARPHRGTGGEPAPAGVHRRRDTRFLTCHMRAYSMCAWRLPMHTRTASRPTSARRPCGRSTRISTAGPAGTPRSCA
jgi:SAM-dependent methyltransferase